MHEKILIVDDEAHIRLLLEQALERLEDDRDAEILTAKNGREALQTIRNEKPHLVLLDVMMPEMNGYEVCQTVKADPELRNIYIIILTAKGQELDRITAEQVGADLFMTKPFNPRKLYATAVEILDR